MGRWPSSHASAYCNSRMFRCSFSVSRVTRQKGSYEYDEIDTASGERQFGGIGVVVMRLCLLKGLPAGNG